MQYHKILLSSLLATVLVISACDLIEAESFEPVADTCLRANTATIQFSVTWFGEPNDLDLVQFRKNGVLLFPDQGEYFANDVIQGGGVEFIRYADTLATDTFEFEVDLIGNGYAPYAGCAKTATSEVSFSGNASAADDGGRRFAVTPEGEITVLR